MYQLPLVSTPDDEQTITVNDKTFDVYRLIHIASETIEPVDIDVPTLIARIANQECWSDDEDKFLTPRKLIREYSMYASWDMVARLNPRWREHAMRVKDADCSYPILVYDGKILDGMHRIVRAFIDQRDVLPVRVFTELPDAARYTIRS